MEDEEQNSLEGYQDLINQRDELCGIVGQYQTHLKHLNDLLKSKHRNLTRKIEEEEKKAKETKAEIQEAQEDSKIWVEELARLREYEKK